MWETKISQSTASCDLWFRSYEAMKFPPRRLFSVYGQPLNIRNFRAFTGYCACAILLFCQTDCACAVTRFMKLLFLKSKYHMKTFHTRFFFFFEHEGIWHKNNLYFFFWQTCLPTSENRRLKYVLTVLEKFFLGKIFSQKVCTHVLAFQNCQHFGNSSKIDRNMYIQRLAEDGKNLRGRNFMTS